MPEIYELSAREAIRGVANGAFTVETLARSHLERIAEIEPSVGAWQHLDEAAVVAEAQRRDRMAAREPLHGLLLAVKDIIDTADMPTTYGSAAYAGHRPPYDATCVALSRAAGALIMGKTVSTEFASKAPGKTRNPYNGAHTPGGSSSGSAAAVAAGMAPLALGTQTAGSIIRPAAYCGIVGYKPSYDVIERTGVKTLAGCFDTVGVMARDVRDVAFYTAIVSGRANLDVPDELPIPKIGLYRTEAWDRALPETAAALERVVAALAKKHVAVQEIPLMTGYDDLLAIHQHMNDWAMLRALSFEYLFLASRISPVTLELLNQRGVTASAETFDAAEARALVARADIATLFGTHDVLLTPAAPGEAPAGLAATGDASFNRGWTMLHLPCVTVPAGRGPKGLPVGVQLVGRKGDDGRTLAAAAFLEGALAEA